MLLTRSRLSTVALAGCGLLLSACGGTTPRAGSPAPVMANTAQTTRAPKTVSGGSWPTFDDNPQRSGSGPANTGVTPADLSDLRRTTVHLDGTVDASVVEVAGVRIQGARRDVIIFTTDYGRTEAMDANSGRRLWEFAPASVGRLQGGPQVTTATPVIDPSHRYVYAASPDGYVHKLALGTGRPVWATAVTHDANQEKIAGALNLDATELVTETDGYNGDAPPYVGHLVTIDPASGRITHVFNTLCSNITAIMASPTECRQSDSAIWGRPGAVVEPDHNILVATANGDFNGRTDWGDSVLEFSPSLKLLHNWTPTDQQRLAVTDQDLGSTEPALIAGRSGRQLAVQGGKDGVLRLLNLAALNGTGAGAGPRTGGELQDINAPGPTDVFSQPAVWRSRVFVADAAGTASYRLGTNERLHLVWHNSDSGTSPIVAGGLLYVYDENAGALEVLNPLTGHRDTALAAGPGHWNSPTVIGGRIFLPVGDDNQHATTGTLYIWHLVRR